METKYWATKPLEEIAKEIESKFDTYKQWLVTSGYANRIKTVYDCYYGVNKEGTLRITRDDNDIAHMSVNHFKSLVRRLHILVTENKLAFTPRSKNSDTKSSIESDLAKGICEYYNDSKGMNDTLSESVLGALLMFEYFVYAPWDYSEGFELGVDGSNVIKTGDQKFVTRSPFDVAKSTTEPDSPWHIIREKVNKYDLASQYPDFAEEILADSMSVDVNDLNLVGNGIASDDESDFVFRYTLLHKRTPSVSDGRLVTVCAGQVLSDSSLGYDKAPIFRISAGDVLQSVFADSPCLELVPLQEALDALFSGTITNNLNNTVQLIWSADPNLTTSKLSDGQVLITSTTPPQALNLTGSAGENFKMIDLLKGDQQLLSGVNDVARGNPASNLKSGTSLAVILAQAIQYVSHLQKSYARLAGDIATCLVNNIQQFASEELTAYIVGSNRKGMVKKFKAQDLLDIERISVDLGNPLTQTYAGRQELMQTWQQYGVVRDPKQIINFLATGNLDAQIEDDFSDATLIASENEMLKKGEQPIVMITDNHMEHILSHKKIFSDPIERQNPVLAQVGLAHIQEHISMMRSVPPDLAAALSGQPLPPVNPPPQQTATTPRPTIEGARMPSLPDEMPAEMADNYEEQLESMPAEQVTN